MLNEMSPVASGDWLLSRQMITQFEDAQKVSLYSRCVTADKAVGGLKTPIALHVLSISELSFCVFSLLSNYGSRCKLSASCSSHGPSTLPSRVLNPLEF